ncbi:META domain-containing protein [Streptomyces sp. NPDC090106]|uniref:META domain-containing protein n=1 Tax=Streptomyces sp. NPDC090106 TaxID=3365946 RepID=UPI003814C680
MTGTRWTLGGDAYLTLGEDGTASGDLGCNTFRGRAAVKDGTLAFGRLSTTRMVCAGPVMKTERELAGILTGKVSYQQKGRNLTLTGPTGDTVVARAK